MVQKKEETKNLRNKKTTNTLLSFEIKTGEIHIGVLRLVMSQKACRGEALVTKSYPKACKLSKMKKKLQHAEILWKLKLYYSL